MIRVSDLSFSYPGSGEPAVRDLSFSVESGEIFGLLGPSGAGKTTTQKILLGLLPGYSGTVRIMEQEVSDFPPSLRKQIGVAFETPALYEKLSGEENLRFFAALQDADGESLKVAFQAAADLGLEGDLSKPVGAYSKGMKVRLNYCRALVHNPRLLFLDEPGAGLDPLLQVRLREHILRQKESGRTIILTTHNMELAEKLCDRLGIISSGKLKALDNPDALKAAFGEQFLEIRTSSVTEKFPLDGLASNTRFLGLLESPDLRSVRTLDASMEQVFIAVSDEQ